MEWKRTLRGAGSCCLQWSFTHRPKPSSTLSSDDNLLPKRTIVCAPEIVQQASAVLYICIFLAHREDQFYLLFMIE